MVEQWGREERRIERRRWRETRRTRASEGGEGRARKGQFDVNRSIVIRVNRLPHCSSTAPDCLPNTIHDICIVVFHSPWNKSGREECRYCDELWVSTVAYHEELGLIFVSLTMRNGKPGSSEGTRLIYLELWAYWCILNSEWGSSLSYNCAATLLNLRFMIFMIFFQYLF